MGKFTDAGGKEWDQLRQVEYVVDFRRLEHEFSEGIYDSIPFTQGAGVLSESASIRELAAGPERTGGLGAIYPALLVTRRYLANAQGAEQRGEALWRDQGNLASSRARHDTLAHPWLPLPPYS